VKVGALKDEQREDDTSRTDEGGGRRVDTISFLIVALAGWFAVALAAARLVGTMLHASSERTSTSA
jgi:hypothetical protein